MQVAGLNSNNILSNGYKNLLLAITVICDGRADVFKERDSNPEAYKVSRYALRRTIKQATCQYRTKIESYYTGSAARRMWQGLQTITDYKGKHSCELPSDTRLPDKLNYFYARFKASNTEECMRASAVLDDCVITLSVADVSKTFKQVNIHKAAGPDVLPGHIPRACADQLESVFTDIFNLSQTESGIPTCFKETTIVPVPKNTKVIRHSPLLYSLFTHDCMARHDSNTIITFANDTTVVGLIINNNETAYREEVRDLAVWCQDNNLSLNVIKTKEMIVD